MDGLRFPVGIETFEKIRKNGYVYVDKTEHIHRLVRDGGYYFLSRPRRFGKSLLLSTIEAFFEGKRELFDGLAISHYEYTWECHPVFRLNLVNFNTCSATGLLSILEQHIAYWEEIYGEDIPGLDLAQRFYGVIKRASEQTGRQAVVLVDEYDKALVSNFEDEKLHAQFREILKPIYGTLKAADRYIVFALIMGVTRFSKLSIFSDINNLSDISLENQYSAICGITEQEMLTSCRHGVEKIADRLGVSFDEAVRALKNNYDGYHFTGKSPDIFNPYSLMSAFRKEEIGNYWFITGTPTFLIERLRSMDVSLPELLKTEADQKELMDIDSYGLSAVALLFQTGYLTIKHYDAEYDTYFLGLPNREVAHGFFKDLLPVYMDDRQAGSLRFIRAFCKDVVAGEAERFIIKLQSFLSDIPYDLSKNKPEIYFENNIYIIFRLMGFTVYTEYRTSNGRIDLLVKTNQYIYIIELKLNGTAEEALQQIEEKGYALPFAHEERVVFKIGISFSHKTRNIDHWIIRK